MPPKKQQLQLQENIDTQEEWDNIITRQGLTVIDVYSEWCGPCKAVVSLFRRIKNELGDDLLRFALAKADTIEALEAYRNRSEPTFLMYSGGVLVGAIHGAQSPLIEKTLKDRLAHEHKVIEGEAEREAVVDEELNNVVILPEDEVKEEEEEKPVEPIKKQVTVLVIKPDAVAAGKVDDIIDKVVSEGYEILTKEERQLTKEEAGELYRQHESSEHFEELVEFMSSGPCMTLVISKGDTGEGVVEGIRTTIGPPDVEEAKEQAPDCIRAQYGTDKKQNAVHASDSSETAARELAFFFPNYNIPWVPGTEPPIQRTLALIRPGALQEHKEAILAKIEEAGFQVAMSKELTLTPEQAAEFYKELEGKDFYESLCAHMSSGPVMVLCLARENAVQVWRDMLGPPQIEAAKDEAPESLRAMYAAEGDDFNILHGADSLENAEKELHFFFPKEQTVAVIKPNAINEKDAIVNKIQESGFNVSLSKELSLTKEMAAQLYQNHTGDDYFNDLTSFMTSGPSLVMVLTKEDAILGWRAMMGPTDPEEAKETEADSLRALYGESVLMNAVHGSSTPEHVNDTIKMVFGDVEMFPDEPATEDQ